MIKLKDLLSEMPLISRQGKKVTADGEQLKSLPVEKVIKNIVIIHSEKETFFTPAGFTLAYFMDSEESAQAMKDGKLDYLIIHDRIRFDFNSAPIRDVWKRAKKNGQEHILGMVQGTVDEKEIYVDKMSVRPGFKQNSINSKLIDALKSAFSGRTVNFSGPTKDGAAFIKKYTGADWKPAHGETSEF